MRSYVVAPLAAALLLAAVAASAQQEHGPATPEHPERASRGQIGLCWNGAADRESAFGAADHRSQDWSWHGPRPCGRI